MFNTSAAVTLALTLALPVLAQEQATRTQRVQFAQGASSTTIRDRVQGYDTVDYLVGARQGQTMHVSMRTSNESSYFTVTEKGADEALYDGTIEGDTFTGEVPANGDMVVRVFLMRNAARRSEHADYALTVAVH